jgi:hypothetical protein
MKITATSVISACMLSLQLGTTTTAFVTPPSVPFIVTTRTLTTSTSSSTTTLLPATKELLSDMDIMCIMNAADLCSYYDECDVEERNALLNRLEEQTEVLADRLAMMSCLTTHLKTGDHEVLKEGET